MRHGKREEVAITARLMCGVVFIIVLFVAVTHMVHICCASALYDVIILCFSARHHRCGRAALQDRVLASASRQARLYGLGSNAQQHVVP